MATWTAADAPSQAGRTFVITGGNSGIGYEAARMLAGLGGAVVLAVRDVAGKGAQARARLLEQVPGAQVEVQALDLSSLASVKAFADAYLASGRPLDVLVNNAGVMATPPMKTADGFELQLGTNHLGHFALTGRLLALLERSAGPRVVNVASVAHRGGRIQFDDLQSQRAYQAWGAYGQSKLANLLFTYELDRRLKAAGKKTLSVACHPGYSATNLQAVGPRLSGSWVMERIMEFANAVVAQPAEKGALPTVFAAVSPTVLGGQYIGPDGWMEMAGGPRVVDSSAASKDTTVAARLWQVSEELTQVRFGLS